MIEKTAESLTQLGLPPGRVHFEELSFA